MLAGWDIWGETLGACNTCTSLSSRFSAVYLRTNSCYPGLSLVLRPGFHRHLLYERVRRNSSGPVPGSTRSIKWFEVRRCYRRSSRRQLGPGSRVNDGHPWMLEFYFRAARSLATTKKKIYIYISLEKNVEKTNKHSGFSYLWAGVSEGLCWLEETPAGLIPVHLK